MPKIATYGKMYINVPLLCLVQYVSEHCFRSLKRLHDLYMSNQSSFFYDLSKSACVRPERQSQETHKTKSGSSQFI